MLTNVFQTWLGRPTLIAADDTWALLALMCVAVAGAIYLEQKYDWASKISGAIIALIIALVASNFSIIPTSCVLYDDIIWGFHRLRPAAPLHSGAGGSGRYDDRLLHRRRRQLCRVGGGV